MKIRKKISVLLIINMLVLSLSTAFFVCPTKADVSTNLTNAINKANELRQNIADGIAPDSNGINQIIKTLLLPAGFICGSTNFTMNQLRDIYNSIIDQNDTDEQVLKKINDQLGNNITVNDNSITFNDNSKNLLKLYANAVADNSGFKYVYDINMLNYSTAFPDAYYYNALRDVYDDYYANYTICFQWNEGRCILTPRSAEQSFVLNNLAYNEYYTVYYDDNLWTQVPADVSGNIILNYNASSHEFESGTYSYPFYGGFVSKETDGTLSWTPNNAYQYFITFGSKSSVYKMYMTLNDLKNASLGNQPYYVSDKWGTYMNNSGNYTVDSSNSNNVSYGDVTNYVNNYYGNNGNYPTPNEIQIIIDNGGGGSGGGDNGGGSGGGDNGGGSGGSTEGIFDFLSKIGEVIGNLIANLGNVLAEILRGISELVSSVMETMPTFLTPLLHFVFGFLPPEIQAVIYLAIVGMLIVGLLNFLKK